MPRVSAVVSGDFCCFKTFLLILHVKYSYFEIFIVVNRPYFVPHTIPYNVFKFSTVPPVT